MMRIIKVILIVMAIAVISYGTPFKEPIGQGIVAIANAIVGLVVVITYEFIDTHGQGIKTWFGGGIHCGKGRLKKGKHS